MNTTENQYKVLIELVANARLLAAISDNEDVFGAAQDIKELGEKAAVALGADKRIFAVKTINRYKVLLEYLGVK